MLSRSGRDVFRDALSIDDATWARARAWAIRAVGGIHYYRETNRRHMQDCLDAIREVLADITPP